MIIIRNQLNKREEGMYKNLKSQIDKITRHNNQGSYKTRSRYEKAIKRFSKHLAKKNVKNIKNINKGHITSYANNLKEDDLSLVIS